MAELETVIETRLKAYEGLAALVSTRIWPMILHRDDTTKKVIYPAVTYQRMDGEREHCMSKEAEVAHPRFQIDSWAKTYAAAKAVATQVRGALQRWDDAATDPVVLDSLMESDEDDYESETGVFHVRSTWEIWHREE